MPAPYVMISAQEFCEITGLTMARFKRYRTLLRNAPPDQKPFPTEVYEYKTTVIFDVEELCGWFIDLYEDMVALEEKRLSEAVKTLQISTGAKDLDALVDLSSAVSRARLGLALYSNRERPKLQKQLDEAHKNYVKLPKEILASKKVLAEAQRLLKKLDAA
ncbi:hypothetical protein [Streptomyces sp. WZ-12]|uniref:hypothetical protein n=1 Tax=Streptomyces sp. WZ-12 TaxID=3030210 RepID=UPI002380D7DA|nr:hypothetical protein [Streptomyces sp. WZ-12]